MADGYAKCRNNDGYGEQINGSGNSYGSKGRPNGKASEFLSLGATVCESCGVTAALANFGLLDEHPHTSNGPGFLEMVSPGYKGQSFYIDKPSVTDNNLITASSTGALLWAKQIIEHLGVFESNTLESWYEYFSTGEPEHFFALMQTLPFNNQIIFGWQ